MTHRPLSEIDADMKVAAAKLRTFREVINEGGEGFLDESEITRLSKERAEAMAALSPLLHDLAGERAWFNSQKFTRDDLAAANKACRERGYSLNELQTASLEADKAGK